MKAIKYEQKHHLAAVSWWAKRSWPVIPEHCLPENGFVVCEGDKLICMGWLYETNSALNAIEWVVSNPDTTKEERDEGLDLLFNSLLGIVKEGAMIIGFSNFEAMSERYEKHGFNRGDESMTLLVKFQ